MCMLISSVMPGVCGVPQCNKSFEFAILNGVRGARDGDYEK